VAQRGGRIFCVPSRLEEKGSKVHAESKYASIIPRKVRTMNFKPLLRLVVLPKSRSSKVANPRTRDQVNEPEPINLSASQREQVETRLAEFIDDSSSVYSHAFAAIARVKALPLFFDWSAFMALCRDGQIVWVPYDNEPGEVEVVREERLRNLGLFQGTRLHPDLPFLLPTRPSDAIDCPACRGTGKFGFSESSKHLTGVICSCGGLGWLPHREEP
jgi:hypothetical protein